MSRVLVVLPLVLGLAGCGTFRPFGGDPRDAAPEPPPPAVIAPVPKPTARTPDQLDTTTAKQRAEARAGASDSETRLGTTVASLGNPTEPGFWIRTPLARTEGPGRIEDPSTGKSVQLRLIPRDGPEGGGSQVSLPALRLLGVSLTALPEVVVYAN
jgi:hypothetical protein